MLAIVVCTPCQYAISYSWQDEIMENHPIPQDVTGFQFKLVGNMTVKQFAYIATGTVFAVIFYYAPIFLPLKFILVPLFAGIGAALAFLPIEGRPADMMITSFIHDLFVPTQYLYHKQGGHLAISTIEIKPQTQQNSNEIKKHHQTDVKRAQQLAQLLNTVSSKGKTALDSKEEQFMQSVFSLSTNPQLISVMQPQGAQQPHQLSQEEQERLKLAESPEDAEKELEKEAEAIKQELEQAQQQEAQLQKNHQPVEQVHEEVTKLKGELDDILLQKQQLEQELQKLKAQMDQSVQPEAQPVQAATQEPEPQQAQPSENVRAVPTDKAATVGLATLPQDPNLVMGIIKDPRGNVLPNILVEIKDQNGVPVRAFKTNGLGQFASATPLANGSYTIEFEDPKGVSKFDVVALEVVGEVLLPLEIISTDAREDLRRELFS